MGRPKGTIFIRSCSVINCTSKAGDGLMLKRFPTDPARRKVWAEKIGRPNWTASTYNYLCEKHFNKDAWLINTQRGKKSTRLKKDAVPSLFVSPSKCFQNISTTPSPSKVAIRHLKQLHSYAKSPSAEHADPSSTVEQFVHEEQSVADLCHPSAEHADPSSTVEQFVHEEQSVADLCHPSAEHADPSTTVEQFVHEEQSVADLCRPLSPNFSPSNIIPIRDVQATSENKTTYEFPPNSQLRDTPQNPAADSDLLNTSRIHTPKTSDSKIISTPSSKFTVIDVAENVTSAPQISPGWKVRTSSQKQLPSSSSRVVCSPQNQFVAHDASNISATRNQSQCSNRRLFAVSPSPGKTKKYYQFYSLKYANNRVTMKQLRNEIKRLKKALEDKSKLLRTQKKLNEVKVKEMEHLKEKIELKEKELNELKEGGGYEKLIELKEKAELKEKELKELKAEVKLKDKELNQLKEYQIMLEKVFNYDQIQYLSKKSKKVKKWSVASIKKGFRHRFTCGTAGYNDLIDAGLPFPSTRTLSRRIEHIKFQSGILHEVIEKLAIKVSAMKLIERDCVLSLDEMALSGSKEFDISTGEMVGDVTLPGHKGEATHLLVFMVGGINSRWKQTVAYYFTGESTDGTVLKGIILDLIKQLEAIKLKVWAVTSDMGPNNQAMWGEFGIMSTRDSLVNSIEHPEDKDRKLYFLADTPHLLKNIRGMLFAHKIIQISDEIANENCLHSCDVNLAHIKAVTEYDIDKNLKIAPHLKPKFFNLSHFEKMNVQPAYRVLHSETASAINFLVNEEGYDPEYLTTAWFLRQIHRWFELMTSRHPVLALSKKNEEVYKETIKFLNDFIKLIKSLEFSDEAWKPIQTGIILTTTSIIQLQEIFLTELGYDFLLTSRFTQDCVENLFSTLRMKGPKPSALEAKRHLKLLTVAQYMKPTVSTSNYDQDDRTFLADFFDPLDKKQKKEEEEENEEIKELKNLVLGNVLRVELNKGEKNSLYNLAGYLARGVIKNQRVCEDCCRQIIRSKSDKKTTKSYESLLLLKEYKEGALMPVNDNVFEMFEKLEENFRRTEMVFPEVRDLQKLLCDTSRKVVQNFRFSSCHNIKEKLIKRFVTCRLRIYAQFHAKKKDKIEFGSKSVCMRVLVKQIGKNQKAKKNKVCQKKKTNQKNRAAPRKKAAPRNKVASKIKVAPKKKAALGKKCKLNEKNQEAD